LDVVALRHFLDSIRSVAGPELILESSRLIFTPNPVATVGPDFRTARNMLVPYYTIKKLGWNQPRLPVTGLCIGPSRHKELNVQSAQLLLRQRGYLNVPVTISKTPFRG
jgi:hypothetical protein